MTGLQRARKAPSNSILICIYISAEWADSLSIDSNPALQKKRPKMTTCSILTGPDEAKTVPAPKTAFVQLSSFRGFGKTERAFRVGETVEVSDGSLYVRTKIASVGAHWSNSTAGQSGRWVEVPVPADWSDAN